MPPLSIDSTAECECYTVQYLAISLAPKTLHFDRAGLDLTIALLLGLWCTGGLKVLDLLAKKETFGEDLDIRVPIHPPWALEDATVLEGGSSTLGDRYHGSAFVG